MNLPPLIGKLEVRKNGKRWELWHLAPRCTQWELTASTPFETVASEWHHIATSTPRDANNTPESEDGSPLEPDRTFSQWRPYRGPKPTVDQQPSRAISVAWDETAEDHGRSIWPPRDQDTPDRVPAILANLTPQQRAVAELLAAGWTQADVARALGVSRAAVTQAISRIAKTLVSPEAVAEISPATHPERYQLDQGPAEAWCWFCTPKKPAQSWQHSGECVVPENPIDWVHVPRGAQL